MAVCPSTAFIATKDYEIPMPKDSKEFLDNMATLEAKKYPVLLNAYIDLRNCWDHYHSQQEKK